MRAIVLSILLLGAFTLSALALPEATATCTSPTQLGCICYPTYFGGQGIRGGFVWRCIADYSGILYLP